MTSGDNTYPKRLPYFACKFVRRMSAVRLANDIGAEACWLLSFIAATEDAKGSRAPVAFWNDDLATRAGLSLSGMKRARDRAIEAGWLAYEPGAKGRAAKYHVLVPDWAANLDDGAGDETPGELSGAIPGQGEPESIQHLGHILPFKTKTEDPPNPPRAGGSLPPARKPKRRASTSGSPAPCPIPTALDTPAFRAAWAEWEAHRREIRKKLTPTTVAKQFQQLAAMGEARALACLEHTIAKGWTGLREPDGPNSPKSRPQAAAPQCRPLTPFESRHVRFNPATGAARDDRGELVLDQLCRDLACEHCRPRRSEVAA